LTTGTTTTPVPSVGAPQGTGLQQGMFTVDQATEAAAKEIQAANVDAANIGAQRIAQQNVVTQAQKDVTDAGPAASAAQQSALSNATSVLTGLDARLSSAQQRVESANAAYSTALTSAMKLVDPTQIDVAQAQIRKSDQDAATAKAQADTLLAGAPGARELTAQQATAAAATAAHDQSLADAQNAKTPYEQQQLLEQARALAAQADSTNALIQPTVDKVKAETGLDLANTDVARASVQSTLADAGLKNAQADYQRAIIPGAPALQAGQTAQAAGAGAASQATAQATLEGIKQKQQGPLYGLVDQVGLIKQAVGAVQQQIFGPGGSGDPNEANDLLNQYVTATIGGTTPFEASKAAASQQGVNYGTQMAGVNALQSAMASRANAYSTLAGGALGTLEQMNAYAPKGSTAMAGAFQSILDTMANRLAQPQFAPTQIPTPPPMPTFLQGACSVRRRATRRRPPSTPRRRPRRT
jgi:hypothetical protein